MDLLHFVVTIILVTASGALAPGPLFIATLSHGAKTGAKTGVIFSIAHTVVEFSLIMVFTFGLITVANEPTVQLIIGVAGGVVLMGFGFMQIHKTISTKFEEEKTIKPSYRNLFFIGLMFSGFNPYFIVWWLTVGAELILISLAFASILGVIFMYVCHVWMDYVWLTTVAYLSKKGTDVLGFKGYKVFIGLFGVILIYFGITFISNALNLKII